MRNQYIISSKILPRAPTLPCNRTPFGIYIYTYITIYLVVFECHQSYSNFCIDNNVSFVTFRSVLLVIFATMNKNNGEHGPLSIHPFHVLRHSKRNNDIKTKNLSIP